MEIWVDADACPAVIKDILCKAANRTKMMVTFVANRPVHLQASSFIHFIRVSKGADVADDLIAEKLKCDDLAITGDIPLAARVVKKGGIALNPRGEIYTRENIDEKLSSRDFMDNLRAHGIETGGPSALSKREIQLFANRLDQILRKEQPRTS